ncbi:MAG: hypothetical protein CMJ82_04500 [Planctomycetaceae bacterium]|nr:hypothetical protein [Planctomycetaceae bacterium]
MPIRIDAIGDSLSCYNKEMLSFTEQHSHPQINRRQAMTLASASMLGLAGGVEMSAKAVEAGKRFAGFGKAKSVLTIFAHGGQSQIDMWDPKPNAPDHVRSIFRPIQTALSGVHFTEDMPGIASVADRMTVIRSMAHADLDHGSAAYLSFTGRYHSRLSSNPPPRPTDMPAIGSVLNYLPLDKEFPYSSIYVNGPALVPLEPGPGQYGGLLGKQNDPLFVENPASGEIAIPGLSHKTVLKEQQMRERLRLQERLNLQSKLPAEAESIRHTRRLYLEAVEMLSSPEVISAFDLSQESVKTREAYGDYRSGQSCLLGRRLVEAGVPYVNVIFNHTNRGQDVAPKEIEEYGWDTHNDIFNALHQYLVPRFDQTISTLIKDLDDRGLLDTTLVVIMSEFGRAPLIAPEPNFPGNNAGRKHWANAYSIALAGAGVQRGAVIGATDRLGGEVVADRYAPWDVTATIFNALGITVDTHYLDPVARPLPITTGTPIEALYKS